MKLIVVLLLCNFLGVFLTYGASYREVYHAAIQAVLENDKGKLIVALLENKATGNAALIKKMPYLRSLMFFTTDPDMIKFLKKKGLVYFCSCCKPLIPYTEHRDFYGKLPCDYTDAEKERMRQDMLRGVFVKPVSR